MTRLLLSRLLLGTTLAQAQDKSIGAQVAMRTAQLRDTEAVLVARLDAEKIDLDTALAWSARIMKTSDAERKQLLVALNRPRSFLADFRAAGGREMVWLIYPASSDISHDPIDVAGIATTASGKVKSVAEFFRKQFPAERFEVIEQDDQVLLASAARLKTLDKTL